MMRVIFRKSVAVAVLVTFTLVPASSFSWASEGAQETKGVVKPEKSPIKTEEIAKEKLLRRFEQLQKKDKEIIALDKQLVKKGFEASKAEKGFWGRLEVYQDENGNPIELQIVIRDYEKKGSKDGAAVGQITARGNDRSSVYSFSLISPEGEVGKTVEYTVDKQAEVVEAQSWWSCVQARLEGGGSVCFQAAVSCVAAAIASGPFSWAAYLGCIALACGGYYAWVSACCGCNCIWWCRWIGCCGQ